MYVVYLKSLDKFQELLATPKQQRNLYQYISAASIYFSTYGPKICRFQSVRFLCVRTLKNSTLFGCS